MDSVGHGDGSHRHQEEKALIKKDIQSLTDQVSLNLNIKSTEQSNIKERVVRQVVKEFKDL